MLLCCGEQPDRPAPPSGNSGEHQSEDTPWFDEAEKAYQDGIAEAVRQLADCLHEARGSSDPAAARKRCHGEFTETMAALKAAYETVIEDLNR
jgi:hypothetical protein